MLMMDAFPWPCQLRILEFLKLKDLLVCRSVCHSWNAMVLTHWRHVPKQVSIPNDLPVSWKFNGFEGSLLKILDRLSSHVTDFNLSYRSSHETANRSHPAIQITSKFLIRLTIKFPALQRLTLRVCTVMPAVNHILQFTQVRSLTLQLRFGWSFGEALLGSWFDLFPQSFRFLRELRLVKMKFVPPTNPSTNWTSLETLVLYDVSVTKYSDFCFFIGNCPNLTILSLNCWFYDLPRPPFDYSQLMFSIPASLRILHITGTHGWWEYITNFDQLWRRFRDLEDLILTYSIFKKSIRGATGSPFKLSTISSLRKLSILGGRCTVGELTFIGSGCFQLTHLNLNVTGFLNTNALRLLVREQTKLKSLHLDSQSHSKLKDAGFLEEIILWHRSLGHVYLNCVEFSDLAAVLKSIMDQLASAGYLGSDGITFPCMERRQPLRLHFLDSKVSNADKIELLADTRAADYLQLRFCEGRCWQWPDSKGCPPYEESSDSESTNAIVCYNSDALLHNAIMLHNT